MILGLCDRWNKTPDEIDAMDADRYLRLANIVALAAPDTDPGDLGG